MTVAEIIELITGEFGTRGQMTSTRALQLLNQIQEIAFSEDLDAFLVSSNFLTISTGSKGPYAFPVNPPVRKLVGVTVLGQDVIMGISKASGVGVSDYGMETEVYPVDSRNFYIPTIIDMFGKTITFLETPSDTANTYRVVYYRKPEPIRSSTDDARLLIPSDHHHTICFQGVIALADASLLGKQVTKETLRPYLQPFWDSLMGGTDPNGQGYISQGTVGL